MSASLASARMNTLLEGSFFSAASFTSRVFSIYLGLVRDRTLNLRLVADILKGHGFSPRGNVFESSCIPSVAEAGDFCGCATARLKLSPCKTGNSTDLPQGYAFL